MSTYLQSYRVGTLSVANGSTSVTGTTTLWLANVLAGDLIIVGSTLAEVASVESNTALTLVSGWTGTTVTGSAYVIHRWSRGWLQAGTTALLLADYVSRIPTFIPTTGAPSDAVGSPGNIAVDTSANVFYVRGATTWGSAVSMVGPAGELTRLDAVAGGDLAAWTGTNSAQIRKATAAEVRTAAGSIREPLTAGRTYYVRTDGSDSNNGLTNTSGGAFLTVQKALDVAASVDTTIFNITISVAAGTYAGVTLKSTTGSGTITVVGTGASKADVVIGSGSGSGITSAVGLRCAVTFSNVTLTGTSYGANLVGGEGAFVTFTNVAFGAASVRAILAWYGVRVTLTGTNDFLNSSVDAILCSRKSYIYMSQSSVSTPNAVTFSGAFVNCTLGGTLDAFNVTFVNPGNVTGKRYVVDTLSTIFTNGGGASYFPGTTAGITANGGIYV